jgi:molybdopterin converting factor small subunit
VNAGNPGVTSAGPPRTVAGTLRYWAAAREAAGTSEEPYLASTLDEALAAAVQRHGDPLRRVFARCAFVVDGTPVSRRDPRTVELSDGGTVEVLPPFAGGAAGLGAAPDVVPASAGRSLGSATMRPCRPC